MSTEGHAWPQPLKQLQPQAARCRGPQVPRWHGPILHIVLVAVLYFPALTWGSAHSWAWPQQHPPESPLPPKNRHQTSASA